MKDFMKASAIRKKTLGIFVYVTLSLVLRAPDYIHPQNVTKKRTMWHHLPKVGLSPQF
jgi:hypothetical protein